jgi:hypothetical protein
MSRGHGALQRNILELLGKYPGGAPQVLPGTNALSHLAPFEWTTERLCWYLHPHETDSVSYSLKASVRRALTAWEREGLARRRPSSSQYRARGSIPWAWALMPREDCRPAS